MSAVCLKPNFANVRKAEVGEKITQVLQ
ncbi:uncharacterized protein METZ01_LOCUS279907 [marine metagenome]|uniref:Uncharacterized protein n=1 Tax=marine metagenome TaxID=408172 RepID=A0A382KU43_9ZZZZ